MNKFYKFIGVSYVFLLVLLAALTHLHVIDLKIYEYININNTLNNFLKILLYAINLFFIIKIISRSKDIKHIKYFSFYILLTLPLVFLDSKLQFIPSFLVPFSAIFFLKMFKEFDNLTIKTLLQRFACFAIITNIVQLLIFFVRFGDFGVSNIQNLNLREYTIISIDLLAYYFIYLKVVMTNAAKPDSVVNFFLAKADSISKNVRFSEESIILDGLKLRQKIIFLIMVYSYQFFTLFLVLAIGIINNKFYELLIMLAMFFVGRYILGRSWHSGKLWICSITTFSSFYILTLFPISLKFTLLGAVSLSAIFTYVLHKIAEIEDENAELRIIKAYIKNFDIDKTTKDELIDRCMLAGMSREETLLAVELFVDKINAKDLAEKYHMAVSTLRNKKVAFKKRLLKLY